MIAVGDPVAWTYEVTNTGNVPLTWSVTDDQVATLACPRLLLIVPGQTISCHGPSGPRRSPASTRTSARSTGTSPSGSRRHRHGPVALLRRRGGIDIEKFTNGDDARQPPGPFIVPGSAVTWTYVVTNTGNAPLTNVAVDDHQTLLRGVFVTCPQTTLAVGESMTCTATGTAEPDQYSNLATATAHHDRGQPVLDVDPSHYFGSVPGIDLEKLTNGDDADDGARTVHPGRRTRQLDLCRHEHRQRPADRPRRHRRPGRRRHLPGDDARRRRGHDLHRDRHERRGPVRERRHGRRGVGPAGQAVTDTDPSHYFGTVSAIDIKKSTNGQDADAAPGVLVPVGDPVTWTYVVTNPGNVPIKR